MYCLRCGYCCEANWVIVIYPDFVDSIVSLENLNERMLLLVKGPEETCPHFGRVDGLGVCAIRDKIWYKDTPCASYREEEFKMFDGACRVGERWLSRKGGN